MCHFRREATFGHYASKVQTYSGFKAVLLASGEGVIKEYGYATLGVQAQSLESSDPPISSKSLKPALLSWLLLLMFVGASRKLLAGASLSVAGALKGLAPASGELWWLPTRLLIPWNRNAPAATPAAVVAMLVKNPGA